MYETIKLIVFCIALYKMLGIFKVNTKIFKDSKQETKVNNMETQKEIKQRMSQDKKLTDILATIISAIETNNMIEFCYEKELLSSNKRTVSPHNLYWNNNKLLLDGFQTQGDSKTNTLQSFKQFDTNFIRSVLILDNQFEINKQYNPTSDRYKDSVLGVT